METHVIEIHGLKPSLKIKAATVLVYAGLYFVIWFTWTLLWPSSGEKARDPLSIAIQGGVIAVIWGAFMVFATPISRTNRNYKLLVEEESITGVTDGTGLGRWCTLRRTIRKGKVRTIFGIAGRLGGLRGISASERSRLGAWFWGFVFLPESMPEYEHLKNVLGGWRAPVNH